MENSIMTQDDSSQICPDCNLNRGGWHACHNTMYRLIERYFSDNEVLDPSELAEIIHEHGWTVKPDKIKVIEI
jgi:hypothetical protein